MKKILELVGLLVLPFTLFGGFSQKVKSKDIESTYLKSLISEILITSAEPNSEPKENGGGDTIGGGRTFG